METVDKLPLTSLEMTDHQREQLKAIFPEVFTEGNRIDWDRLRLTLGEAVDTGKERFGLNWPGKADCFKTIQQPSRATLLPAPEEGVHSDDTQNVFIEGDNLEVLKLLQKSYLGQVKMIYIDPPYNTGNDFIYPDNYGENLDTYLAYTGQVDEQGRRFATNTDTDGRFHSKWLNMMYPRLFLAKNLLREDGVIFISIDDNEVHNLRALCNEIFGEENFVGELIVENNPKGRVLDKYVATSHEYLLCYSKDVLIKGSISIGKDVVQIETDYPLIDDGGRYRELELRNTHREFGKHNRKNLYFPIYYSIQGNKISLIESVDSIKILPIWEDGFEGCWTWGEKKVEEEINLLVVKQVKGVHKVYRKSYANDATRKLKSILINKDFHTEKGQSSFNTLFESKDKIFQSPKAPEFLKELLKTSGKTGIILDFFAGSATTAHAVLELNKEDGGNRKFICVQLPEPTSEDSEAGKAGYQTIADISKERIRRVIKRIEQERAQLVDEIKQLDDSIASKEEQAAERQQTANSGSLFTNTDAVTNQVKAIHEQIAKLREKITEKEAQIERIDTTDKGFRVFKLAPSNFNVWDANVAKTPEAIQTQLFNHIDHIRASATQADLLTELLLKSGFPLTTPIETLTLAGKTVYSVADGELLVCLEEQLTPDVIKAIADRSPSRVICLDAGFQHNDPLKTNATLLMKDRGVVKFQTV